MLRTAYGIPTGQVCIAHGQALQSEVWTDSLDCAVQICFLDEGRNGRNLL